MSNEFFKTLANVLSEVTPSRILSNEVPDDWWELSIHKVNNKHGIPAQTVLKHPISAEEKPLEKLSEFWSGADDGKRKEFIEAIRKAEEEVFSKLEGAESPGEFARLWNELPQKLKEGYEKALEELNLNPDIAKKIAEELVHFPADPSFPDHDWLTRTEFYATVKAIKGSGKKPYLLRFKISPVQGFIGNARKELDFWAGSHLLSRLTYFAIEVILRETWPGGIIFPHLRGQPFFENDLKSIDPKKYDIPNMPNKVLAVIGVDANSSSEDFEKTLEKRIKEKLAGYLEWLLEEAWQIYDIDNFLKNGLQLSNSDVKKEKEISKEILKDYFYITVSLWPYEGNLEVVDRHLREVFSKLGREDENVLYPYLFALLDQKTEFKSNKWERREVPDGFKCTVCGEIPAIGQYARNPGYRELRKAWNNHTRKLRNRKIYDIKDGEMLCPLCLVKRVYPRKYLNAGNTTRKRVESVSEVAIRKNERLWQLWKRLTSNESNPNLFENLKRLFKALGRNSEVFYIENVSSVESLAKVYGISVDELENIFQTKGIALDKLRNEVEAIKKEYGEPPKYYAILKMDGDNMGKLISGTKGMKKLSEYPNTEDIPNVPDVTKPVTPAIHVAITRSLSRFAVETVPNGVERHKGETILAGGDDVLAFLPTNTVIKCAHELQEKFRTNWDGFHHLQGSTRSMSAGILVVHYKEPLYHAYELVGELEHLAKESGRNAIAIGYLTHSGNFYSVVVNWDIFSDDSELWKLLGTLGDEMSTRLIYEIFEDIEHWPDDPDAIESLITYEFKRHVKTNVEELVRAFLWTASHIRVGNNEKVLEKLAIDPMYGDVYYGLRGSVSFWQQNFNGKIMREQLKNAAMLLRILRKMGV
ncbi:type III-B CRISPR-associated protein Cas10/Cmr2 [Thermococcus sp. MAR1]|uniref:type III-B CRISPR-associated protein Cas10/Cmr2 n=1 Tax=Thermococcus sp. MAR1 TaxID=1638263 RepID=UPI00143886AB|nr:type III-B CRISPR-associated protein Cas10/Cmr2 [Thermococcus sp. MAR1]NJE10071.1 type III-B CRISPR-associated protein Cas10/Cmr2 [Thermococcus sp. MAR1]